jgi:hypothetical protein
MTDAPENGEMNISHLYILRYQNVEISDMCRLVSILPCFNTGIPHSGFQQCKRKSTSNTCRQTGNHPPVFRLAKKEIRREIITTAIGC